MTTFAGQRVSVVNMNPEGVCGCVLAKGLRGVCG